MKYRKTSPSALWVIYLSAVMEERMKNGNENNKERRFW